MSAVNGTQNGLSKLEVKSRNDVKEYYGQVLSKSDDLKTNACTCDSKPPAYIRKIMPLVHEEVHSKYYGCGFCVPDLLEGCKVLDLGCGAGRDCFLLSKLVGPTGEVIGVDMTDEQLAVANKHVAYHTEKFGYPSPNVSFKKGYIEMLDELNIPDNYFDVIVSNCVINLSQDKQAVFKQAFRMLKSGGEIYFSDVYADRRVPKELQQDPVLFGECLSGALYWNDFLHLARKCGFTDPRLVNSSPIDINNEELEAKIGHIKFYSATYRLFKLDDLEPDCEDYGQAVIYKGTIETCPKEFLLDGHHLIAAKKVFPVCGNTLSMLTNTRYAPHFDVVGDGEEHYGIFAGCGKPIPFEDATVASSCC